VLRVAARTLDWNNGERLERDSAHMAACARWQTSVR
jgi:hypothetical protein